MELIARLQKQNAYMRESLAAQQPKSPQDAEATAASSGKLEQLLAEVIQQNRDLQTKLAETNRDVMALEFRVDSHSEEFRPLNVADPGTYSVESYPVDGSPVPGIDDLRDDIGVLPPLDVP